MSKKLTRGCVVFMKASSGLTGYGNGQCVSSICEQLGTISLFGHNQNYSISDIDRIAEYSLQEENKRLREALGNIRDRKPLMSGKNSAYFAGFGDALSYCKEDAEQALEGE